MRDIAIEAAKKGGEILAKYFEMTGLERELKDDTSFVTKADKEAEAAIVAVIARAFPDHGIVGEEGADVNPHASFKWIIDPIDGTRNFVNGIPIFAVSIGVAKDGEPVAAVIYNPVTNSLYAAEAGKGATYNGKKVTVSGQAAQEGVVTLGYGSKDSTRARHIFGESGSSFKTTRMLGCCALELAYVARGGTEGFIGLGLKKWDYAAGLLLVREAGGRVTDLGGAESGLDQGYFVASNGIAHEAALTLANSVG
jgi:myo-inositol-1(or 4)-monophosphatase